jgi:hypothetical protein
MKLRTIIGAAMALAVASFALVAPLAIDSAPIIAVHAFAADQVTTTTSVPWGDWIAALLSHTETLIIAVLGVVATWAIAKLPASLGPIVHALLTEQVLNRAVDYGIGAVAGAVKGKTADLQTTNAVLAQAEAFAVHNAPALVNKLGDTLLPKLFARVSAAGIVGPDVTAASVGAAVPRAT